MRSDDAIKNVKNPWNRWFRCHLAPRILLFYQNDSNVPMMGSAELMLVIDLPIQLAFALGNCDAGYSVTHTV